MKIYVGIKGNAQILKSKNHKYQKAKTRQKK